MSKHDSLLIVDDVTGDKKTESGQGMESAGCRRQMRKSRDGRGFKQAAGCGASSRPDQVPGLRAAPTAVAWTYPCPSGRECTPGRNRSDLLRLSARSRRPCPDSAWSAREVAARR